jgi:DNA-binding response OmpR family regulator
MSSAAGRILIADDDDTFLHTTADLLTRAGFDCACVPDAAAATALLSVQEFDLLIADIRMPGNEELELIRQHPQIAAGLPVILVTGYPTVATAISSIHLAVADYAVKPVEFVELLAKVREAIASYHALRAARRIGQQLEAWCSETALLEKSLRTKSAASAQESLKALAKLAYGRALETLSEARKAGVPVAPISDVECAIVGCARLDLCLHTLKDAVAVLRRTKNSFKSKDLAMLRERLEQVLGNLGEPEEK